MKKVLGGWYREAYTSDFILDEIISRLVNEAEKGRLQKREIIKLAEESIQNSIIIKLEHIDESTVGTAKACFRKYYDKFLSLTDWT